jgi:hypothetical protein
MAFKAIGSLAIFMLLGLSIHAQQHNPDSVVFQVLDALTADPVPLPANIDDLLIGPEWEALAYWEIGQPKQLESLNEAVGDIYQFQPTSFVIKLVDPGNPRSYLQAITGKFKRTERRIVLTSANGKELVLDVMFVDGNYLVVEMDGLRLFFTQSRSFNAQE